MSPTPIQAAVVGRGLKQSGMFWSEAGAENLQGLRCLIKGPHIAAAWKVRRDTPSHDSNPAPSGK